jgi:F-type H+-transporting ATPase subunit c
MAKRKAKRKRWHDNAGYQHSAAALAVSFGAIGPALAEGRAVAAAMDAIARQPEAAGTLSRTLFVGLAMIETMAIYCLVVALLLLFANPFIH